MAAAGAAEGATDAYDQAQQMFPPGMSTKMDQPPTASSHFNTSSIAAGQPQANFHHQGGNAAVNSYLRSMPPLSNLPGSSQSINKNNGN